MLQIEKLSNEYRENKRLIDELSEINDALKVQIIELMAGHDTVIAGATKITYKDVRSSRFDGTAFKADHADLYSQYSKTSAYKRFSIS